MTRLIAIGLAVLFIAACTAQHDAHVRTRDAAGNAIVTPGAIEGFSGNGAVAAGRAK